MAAAMVTRGRIVLWKPMAKPVINVGALPVWAVRAMVLTGGPDVKYSLSRPIRAPAIIPIKTDQKMFICPSTEPKRPFVQK